MSICCRAVISDPTSFGRPGTPVTVPGCVMPGGLAGSARDWELESLERRLGRPDARGDSDDPDRPRASDPAPPARVAGGAPSSAAASARPGLRLSLPVPVCLPLPTDRQ
jgi:hypothetical protein